jgi:predicted dehydrogenase
MNWHNGMKEDQMQFTVIGLGSMGTRRIKCLKELGYTNICGIDTRDDRRQSAEKELGITTCQSKMSMPYADAMFICTPPDKHLREIMYAAEHNIPAFVEHGISAEGLSGLINLPIKPSCTMLFHPTIKRLKSEVANGDFGNISNVIYHSGQYLPSWHPNENLADCYTSKRETGGAREIVPFELTWLVDVFGWPTVKGDKRKTIEIEGADIDDTYNCLLDFGGYLGVMVVDVVHPTPIRRLKIVGSKKTVEYDLNADIKLQTIGDYEDLSVERIYIDETKAFLDGDFPNSLEREIKILKLLQDIET